MRYEKNILYIGYGLVSFFNPGPGRHKVRKGYTKLHRESLVYIANVFKKQSFVPSSRTLWLQYVSKRELKNKMA